MPFLRFSLRSRYFGGPNMALTSQRATERVGNRNMDPAEMELGFPNRNRWDSHHGH